MSNFLGSVQRILHHIFYATQIADRGIVGAVFLHAKKVLEIIEYSRCHILYWNVGRVVVKAEKFLQIVGTTGPTLIGGLNYVATVKFFLAFFVGLAEHLYHHFLFLAVAQEQ